MSPVVAVRSIVACLSVSFLGVILAGIHLRHAVTMEMPLLGTITGAVLPLLLSLGIVYLGYRIFRSETDYPIRFCTWTVAGAGVMVVIGGSILVHHLVVGRLMVGDYYTVGNLITLGAYIGALVGYYDRELHHQLTAREERGRMLEALNDAMRTSLTAETREEVAEIGVEGAREILDLKMNAIHLYDEESEALVPAAMTDDIEDFLGDLPTFTGEDGIAWRVYERGEVTAIGDVRDDPDVYDPETPIRSELYLPLGEHGILIAGSPVPGMFDQQDVTVGKIMAANVTAALDQVENERRLRARERELSRQNDRLENFASIVSHDLRNPLNIATGRLDLVRAECDGNHVTALGHALTRMETLIEDLLTLARAGKGISSVERVALGEVSEICWTTVETAGATLVVETDQLILADRNRLQQLLENLVRNAVEHGGEDVTIRIGALGDERGFYVEDDGSGIPDDERDAVFESGYSTAEDGTGFGLAIANEIAEAHGWGIRAVDGEPSGARFEITGVDIEV